MPWLEPDPVETGPICPDCLNARHVRGPDGKWRRCHCARLTLRKHFITTMVQAEDTDYDPACEQQPPIPLTTSYHTGDYRKWRHMVWRSLIAYEPMGISYDMVTAQRFIDMQFGQEVSYENLSEIRQLQLLILPVSSLPPNNRLFGSLFLGVLEEREGHGRPTWVHVRDAAPGALKSFFTTDPSVKSAVEDWVKRTSWRKW